MKEYNVFLPFGEVSHFLTREMDKETRRLMDIPYWVLLVPARCGLNP
jgi:hypothetical protein